MKYDLGETVSIRGTAWSQMWRNLTVSRAIALESKLHDDLARKLWHRIADSVKFSYGQALNEAIWE